VFLSHKIPFGGRGEGRISAQRSHAPLARRSPGLRSGARAARQTVRAPFRDEGWGLIINNCCTRGLEAGSAMGLLPWCGKFLVEVWL